MSAVGSVSILDVERQFSGLVAHEDVSLEIPAGRIHGVSGPTGASKTALLNVPSGLQRPTGGTIFVYTGMAPGGPATRRSRRRGLFKHLRRCACWRACPSEISASGSPVVQSA